MIKYFFLKPYLLGIEVAQMKRCEQDVISLG